jgi:hypothetical protein
MNVCSRYPCFMTTSGHCPMCNPHPAYISPPVPAFNSPGCICPPTSEKTCESPTCPRKNHLHAAGAR